MAFSSSLLARSNLIVSKALATCSATGNVDMSRADRRTIIPIPAAVLTGLCTTEDNRLELLRCTSTDPSGEDVPDLESFFKYQFDLYSSLIEYHQLAQYCPTGIYCMPTLNNLRLWTGIIFVRYGLYKNGTFRFNIQLAVDYPASAPIITFTPPILPYHPLVDPDTGIFNINKEFPKWEGGTHYMCMLLGFLKRIFYIETTFAVDDELLKTESSGGSAGLNCEAARLFNTDQLKLADMIEKCAKDSSANLFPDVDDDDPLAFSEFDPVKHGPILKALRAVGKEEISVEDASDVFADWILDNTVNVR